MQTRWHQAYAPIGVAATRTGGTGGLGRDGIGIGVTSAGCVVLSNSGGSWLSGRRGGCGIAPPWPLRCLAEQPLDLNARFVVRFPATQIRQQNYSQQHLRQDN